MAEGNEGAAAAAGTAAGPSSAASTGSPGNTGTIPAADRIAAGLPLESGSDDAGGAPDTNVNQGGPGKPGQPSTGDSKPDPSSQGAEGSKTTDGGADTKTEPNEVDGLLAKYGLKPVEKPADGTSKAGSGNETTKPEGTESTIAEIEKAINPDGKVPLEQQKAKAVEMAAAGQRQIGNMAREVGAYRKLCADLSESGWFNGVAEGKLQPNIVALADALAPEQFIAQIRTEEAAQKLAARGLKIVPLDEGNEAQMDRFEREAAKQLVPGDLTHEQRLDAIKENVTLQTRLATLTAKLQMQAEGHVGAQKLRSQAALTQARQEVAAELAAMEKNNPELWQTLRPLVAQHGAKLPSEMNHKEGLAFAVARAYYDQLPNILRDAYTRGVEAGRKLGQGDAGLIVAPQTGGGKKPSAPPSEDFELSAEDRAKAGLPPVA